MMTDNCISVQDIIYIISTESRVHELGGAQIHVDEALLKWSK